jgi:chemotaxis protein MotB
MAMEEDPPAGVPEWVVTYGDMMSLLLTFFIMLVSMSKMKEEGTMRAMLDAVSAAFGASNGPSASLEFPSNAPVSIPSPPPRGTRIREIPRRTIEIRGNGGPNPQVRTISKGTVVTMGGPVIFEKDSAELLDQLKSDLEQIASMVRDKANLIEVKGHASRSLSRKGAVTGSPRSLLCPGQQCRQIPDGKPENFPSQDHRFRRRRHRTPDYYKRSGTSAAESSG